MLATEDANLTAVRLRFSVLGGFSICNSVQEHISVPNRKACGLLAYLAINKGRSVSRERLAGLLWSDSGEDQARASLRQCLKQLRTLFDRIGFGGLVTERQDITLTENLLDLDMFEVLSALNEGRVDPLLRQSANAPSRLLYGYENLDHSFSSWLHVIRQNWHEQVVDELQQCMKNTGGNEAKHAADALVAMDASHEEAQRYLIRYHADHGNISAALKQYKMLWDLLDEEFEVEPDEETQTLIVEIKAGTYRGFESGKHQSTRNDAGGNGALSLESTPPDGPIEPRMPVIGIGKFSQGGPWNQEIYLIDGFRRELIASLVRFREWLVVDDPGIGAGDAFTGSIDYRLEGVYLEEGSAVRLIITLKDTATQRFIWSEQLTVSSSTWYNAQQDIVRRISLTLNVYLSAEKLSHVVREPALTEDAYHKWLKAHHELLFWNPVSERSAETALRELVRTMPNFSLPLSGLATVYNTTHLRNPGRYHKPEHAVEALHLAKKAVALDPLDTRNQMALAWSYVMNGRFDKAELHFNLTNELNPNSPSTLVPTAQGLSYCGKYGDALKMAETAIDLHPMLPEYHWGFIMCIQFFNGNFEKSVEAAELAQDVITDFLGWKAAALAYAGRTDDAKVAADRFLEVMRSRWDGPETPSAIEIMRWFMHAFPIRHAAARDMLRQGLLMAGLPALN